MNVATDVFFADTAAATDQYGGIHLRSSTSDINKLDHLWTAGDKTGNRVDGVF